MFSFWMLATCECGIFASAHIEFCLYCIGGYVFVHHQECGPQLTCYHEDHCLHRDADFDPRSERPGGDPSDDAVGG